MEGDPIRTVRGNTTFTYKLGDQIKSEGNHGALVFKGLFNGTIPIALKRYQKIDEETTKQVQRDLDILASPKYRHPNIIRYYGHISHDDFSYIATELCECSVADIIDPKRQIRARDKTIYFEAIVASLSKKEILRQSSEAVSFLHRPQWNVIHRNLHPDNFLIACVVPNKNYFLIKLTDFQLSKHLEENPQNTGTTNKEGWVAPESFKDNINLDSKVDAFVLGCYYFYVLSEGKHPFGRGVVDQRTRIKDENDEVYRNSWDGKPEWNIHQASSLNKQEEAKCALELIKGLIKYDPKDRKSVDDVLKSKYFQQKEPMGMMKDNEEWMFEVGESLKYDEKDILGRGSYGSIVFSGLLTLDDNKKLKVATKRLQLSFVKSNFIEEFKKRFIRTSEEFEHANILRYLAIENDSNFLYLVTELCGGTLEHLVKGSYKGPPVGDIDEIDILLQITKGVAHLHNKLKIVHRDIKPSNVLISFSTSNNEINSNTTALFKLADLGIITTLITDHRDFKKKKTYVDPHGTHEWLAPEMFDSDLSDYDFSVDIFPLGCLFGYTLSGGKHPFGDSPLEQTMRILEKKEIRLAAYDLKCYYYPKHDKALEGIELIRSMVRMNPKENPRPTIDDVLNDRFFSANHAGKETKKGLHFGELDESTLSTSDQKEISDIIGPNTKIIDQVFSMGLIVFSGLYKGKLVANLYKGKLVAINRIRRNLHHTRKNLHDPDEMFWDKETLKLRGIKFRDDYVDKYFATILHTKTSWNFRFIVTDMWDATLEDYIEGKCQIPIKFKDPREILLPVTKGLEYLHHRRIYPILGNIRPNAIFIYQKSDGMIVKISDLMTSAALVETRKEVLRLSGGFDDDIRWYIHQQYCEDIFALGHLFAYTFNIGRNKYSLDEGDGIGLYSTLEKLSKLPNLKHFTEPIIPIDEFEVRCLIKDMVDINPRNRPRLAAVLSSSFFRDYEELQRKSTDDIHRSLSELSLEKTNASSSANKKIEKENEGWTICFGCNTNANWYKKFENECKHPRALSSYVGGLEYFIKLVEHGVEVNSIKKEDGATPLHYLCKHYKHKDLIKLIKPLIEKGPKQVKELDKGKRNPLHILSENYKHDNLEEIVKLLIDYGVDVNAKRSGDEKNALHLLCSHYRHENLVQLVELLFEKSSDRTALLNEKDSQGWTPLHYLCRNYEHKEQLIKLIELFFKSGANVNEITKDGWTPLSILCTSYNNENLKELLLLLLEKGAEVNSALAQADGGNIYPLHQLCYSYDRDNLIELVQLLINKGHVVDPLDLKNATPLYYLSLENTYNGNNLVKIIEFFIENGADINRYSTHGKSPLSNFCKKVGYNGLEIVIKSFLKYLKPDVEDKQRKEAIKCISVHFKGDKNQKLKLISLLEKSVVKDP